MLSGMAEEAGDKREGLRGNNDLTVAACGYLCGVAGGELQGVWLVLGGRWARLECCCALGVGPVVA